MSSTTTTTSSSSSSSSKPRVYFGETLCSAKYASGAREGAPCTSKAYYSGGSGRVYCGTHSPQRRTKLPKNPDADAQRRRQHEEHADTVEAAREANKSAGKRGSVVCSKLRMMGRPEDVVGHLKVFPNFKHQNRKDGFGCASLSPMSLGPVRHAQKGLPVSKNLENYHQFNKVYSSEVGKDRKPCESFRRARVAAYKSGKPQRHKVVLKKGVPDKSVAFSVHSDPGGEERHYTYVESRYFYCHFYEKLASKMADFQTLKDKLKDGYNLQIVGYDGVPMDRDVMRHYMDLRLPFGHERVLVVMLSLDNPDEYPWNKYHSLHSDIYPRNLAPREGDTESSSEAESETGSSESDMED